jgi:hypothetical protein
MITKEEVVDIEKNYLKEKKREYLELANKDSVGFRENQEVLFGKREGEIVSQYFIEYTIQYGVDREGMLIYIDANTGEVLFSLSPTSWIEETEI